MAGLRQSQRSKLLAAGISTIDALAASAEAQPVDGLNQAVLQRLRALQRDMAIASLNHCIERGLLSKADARQLAAQMGLQAEAASGQRP